MEAAQLWSLVSKKEDERWIWLILERSSRQIIALHIGDRRQTSADALWAKVPRAVKTQPLVLTDRWEAYGLVIPTAQHTTCEKQSG